MEHFLINGLFTLVGCACIFGLVLTFAKAIFESFSWGGTAIEILVGLGFGGLLIGSLVLLIGCLILKVWKKE